MVGCVSLERAGAPLAGQVHSKYFIMSEGHFAQVRSFAKVLIAL
jgi:hypothetical protein